MSEYERSEAELNLIRSRIPYLYDFFYEVDQRWPFYTMAWGPMLEGNSTIPDPSINQMFDGQMLYYAQSTSSAYDPVWNTLSSEPHLLVQAEVALPNKYNVADMQKAANQPNNRKRPTDDDDDEYRLWIKDRKKLVHPGEVNRIAVVPSDSNLVVTHTDHPRVLLWDFNIQKSRQSKSGARGSVPDLVLVGHDHSDQLYDYEKTMYFALDVCKSEPLVASGGPDQNVIVWSIADYESAAATSNQPKKAIDCRNKFTGHSACVEDVAWHPSSSAMVASVGDDRSLRLWDLRTNHAGLLVATGHQDDVNALSWNPRYDQYILTASSDMSVHLIDIRYVRESVASTHHLISVFDAHEREVKCVTWSPDGRSFASGGDDARVNIWSLNNVKHGDSLPAGGQQTTADFFVNREYAKPVEDQSAVKTSPTRQADKPLNPQVAYSNMLRKITPGPSSLKFSHKVHPTAILSLNWNPYHLPGQTICSVSGINGGCMQIWRINELLQMPILQAAEKVRCGKRLREAEKQMMRPASMRPPPPGQTSTRIPAST